MTAISLAEMQALTVVYGTRHMWSTLQRQCDRFLRGFGEEPACMFWRAFSGVLAGNVVEGMRDLERLRDYEECGLAALLALVYAHKLAKFVGGFLFFVFVFSLARVVVVGTPIPQRTRTHTRAHAGEGTRRHGGDFHTGCALQ